MMKPMVLCILTTSTFSILAGSDGPIEPRVVRERSSAANIRVDVNMVLVPVSVTDAVGRSVTGLRADNFRVLDGARPVPIVSFGRQDQPITVGLIFDCSRSMTEKFRTARQAPRELFEQLNPDDESFLITISDRAELRAAFTSNFDELQNSLIFTHPHGMTSLIDGIYMGLQRIRKSRNPRRALVVVSDGGDNHSRYTLPELDRLAEESDAQIFATGLYFKASSQEERDGPALMSDLCLRTGGANYIIRSGTALRDAMTTIGVALHNQYVLGYYPPPDGASGKYRKIQVHLLVPSGLPPLQIHARAGYYMAER
jgi:Ca-activated chloride channel family protein